ncbi:MAG: phosphate-starvation-inducible PsiE family protein, partial [Nitrospira sp.]|nr:phosphate-starvation-inducible PsiE family protein [Nitrospira sp.]
PLGDSLRTKNSSATPLPARLSWSRPLLQLPFIGLLVIILLELFRTTINFLKTKVIALEPFLYICVIASTRRILTTGAQISYMDELTDLVFNRYLMDLGANVLVVVALIVAVYVSRRASPPATVAESEAVQGSDRKSEETEWRMRESGGQVIGIKKEYA